MTISIQDCGGTAETVAAGVESISHLISGITINSRVPVPLSDLVIGLNCGGSDAFSILTSNPLLGLATDFFVDQGSSVVLAETPEIYGAEQLLIERCSSSLVKSKLQEKLRWWSDYTEKNMSMSSNPAPGNKKGGITTIAEKSLGAICKSGSRPINDILDYSYL